MKRTFITINNTSRRDRLIVSIVCIKRIGIKCRMRDSRIQAMLTHIIMQNYFRKF